MRTSGRRMTKLLVPILVLSALSRPVFAAPIELSLDESITLALQNNSDIKIAASEREQNSWALKQAKAGKGFSLSLTHSDTRYSSPTVEFADGRYSRDKFASTVSASLPVYSGGKLESQIEQAKLGLDIADLTVEATRQQIKQNVTTNYFGVLQYQQELQVNRETVDNYTAHLKNVRDKYEVGTVAKILVVLDDTAIRAQVAQYKAQVTNYASIYERTRKLTALGGESAQQLDSDQTNYLVAKANYDNYVTQLGYYVITAPIDGVVIGEPTPAGQTVVQGISEAQVLMTVADMSQMQVKVMVDETDIGKVKTGQTVSFTVDTYTDKTFTGEVTRISKDATTSSNVVYYYVYVDVDSPQGLLYPTMTARVTLHVGESKNALVVPLSAIKEEKGQKYVQVMVNGQLQNQPVQIGLSNDEQTEILSGLNEGDQVVLPAAKAPTANAQRQGPPPPL